MTSTSPLALCSRHSLVLGTPGNAQWRAQLRLRTIWWFPLPGGTPGSLVFEKEGRVVESADPLSYWPEFDIQHLIQFLALKVETPRLFQAIMNLPGTSASPLPRGPLHFSCNPVVALSFGWINPYPWISGDMAAPSSSQKITVCDKSTSVSPSVSVAFQHP